VWIVEWWPVAVGSQESREISGPGELADVAAPRLSSVTRGPGRRGAGEEWTRGERESGMGIMKQTGLQSTALHPVGG